MPNAEIVKNCLGQGLEIIEFYIKLIIMLI